MQSADFSPDSSSTASSSNRAKGVAHSVQVTRNDDDIEWLFASYLELLLQRAVGTTPRYTLQVPELSNQTLTAARAGELVRPQSFTALVHYALEGQPHTSPHKKTLERTELKLRFMQYRLGGRFHAGGLEPCACDAVARQDFLDQLSRDPEALRAERFPFYLRESAAKTPRRRVGRNVFDRLCRGVPVRPENLRDVLNELFPHSTTSRRLMRLFAADAWSQHWWGETLLGSDSTRYVDIPSEYSETAKVIAFCATHAETYLAKVPAAPTKLSAQSAPCLGEVA